MKRLIALVVSALALAGCGAAPGGDGADRPAPASTAPASKPDIAKAGDVTLTVWDQEVRGGQRRQIERLNAEFMAKYPNVKIERVAKSFEDLVTTVKLAVSGPDAPDVVQANQGRPIMGELVKAGLLRPISDYAEVYGWEERYSPLLLDLNRFSSDGKQFGSGELYGLSQMGEIVGLFYNRTLVPEPPRTLEELEASLAEFKAAGRAPIQFGNSEKWPGIHEFESVLGQVADKQAVRDFVFAADGTSFDTPEFQAAARRLVEWVDAGYFNKGFNGTGYDAAWKAFAKGESPYLIAGTWVMADLVEQMGDDVGFVAMPGKDPEAPVSLGGESLPFAITSAAEHPDVAAAYIDFLTDANAASVLVETDNLPAMKGAPAPSGGVAADVAAAWEKLNETDGLIPYLDYATPTFYDDISSAIQELLAGKRKPEEFTAGVQAAFDKWAASN